MQMQSFSIFALFFISALLLYGLFAFFNYCKEEGARIAAERQAKNQEGLSKESQQGDEAEEAISQVLETTKWLEESANRAQANYETIEAAIAINPLSAKYRRETQQQTANFRFMEIDKFITQAAKSFVAVDIETTGLNPQDDQIIEIAAVKVENGAIVSSFSQLIDPGQPIPSNATNVNHITDDMVYGMPRIYDIIPDFLEFVGNNVLVAHNAQFDAEFFTMACMRYRFKVYKKWFDSIQLKAYWPGLANRKLQTFLSAAGIENIGAHRAGDDAQALAKLVIKTLDRISSITP